MTQPDEYTALMSGSPPTWADGWGEDEHGGFAELWVGRVCQRFRWIKPGELMMGSPKTEEGRFEDEGPRHKVILTRGFWLADTPCTQSLWEAVMGENPSRFKSQDRPVERVSWDEALDFIVKLNKEPRGAPLRLPSEAEWEYACRAGTTEPRYGALNEIAWYSENSGGETHPVKKKKPNRWGLFDMLGNVLEWCADWNGSYTNEEVVDPTGPTQGGGRVIRGGAWNFIARSVRAAYRLWYPPDNRDYFLGFRLSRGQGSAPSQAGDGRSPESSSSAPRSGV